MIKMNGGKSCTVSLLLEEFRKKYDPKGFRNSLQKVQVKSKQGNALANNLNSLYSTNTGVSRISSIPIFTVINAKLSMMVNKTRHSSQWQSMVMRRVVYAVTYAECHI